MIRFDDIVEKLNPYLKSSDIDEIKKAYAYSAKVHAGQKRYSGEPSVSYTHLTLPTTPYV